MRTGKPSATACVIAASMAYAARQAPLAKWVPPISARLAPAFMRGYGAPASWLAPLATQRWSDRLVRQLDRATIPGVVSHWVRRKAAIEGLVRGAIAAGRRQLVVLGAGFDLLAYRLALEFQDLRCIEVDYPCTQRVKREVLEREGLPQNLSFVASDFVEEGLGALRIAHDEASLFLAEGVLMYVPESRAHALFDEVSRLAGPGSQFLFTVMEPAEDGVARFHHPSRVVDAWMRVRREPFRWGANRAGAAAIATQHGFQLERFWNGADLAREFPTGDGSAPAMGECLCIATKEAA